jgi:hypothetical protein
MMIFEEIPSIPVGILLEPLVKQSKLENELEFSIAEFDFFIITA